MKALILLLMSAGFLMACSPKANFSSDEARFQSLMDGQTVEIVENDELIDSLDQPGANTGDDGIMGDGTTGDDGTMGGNPGGNAGNGAPNIPGVMPPGGNANGGGCVNCTGPNPNNYDGEAGNEYDGETGRRRRGMSCRDRLIRQDRERENRTERERSDMLTSPEEIEGERAMREALRCGNGGNKVLVCHHPNADYEKRHTLCIGLPALKAQLRNLGFKRATAQSNNSDESNDSAEGNDSITRNYAGACRDMENEEDSTEEDGLEEEQEEVERRRNRNRERNTSNDDDDDSQRIYDRRII